MNESFNGTYQLNYASGDATLPVGDGPKILSHVVNDLSGWGKGFVVAISTRWTTPEDAYRDWARVRSYRMSLSQSSLLELTTESIPFELGQTQFVRVKDDLLIANMLAQHGYRSAKNPVPLDYAALAACLKTVADLAARTGASVHMPRIGSGLSGGKWPKIEQAIINAFSPLNIPVTIYDLGPRKQ